MSYADLLQAVKIPVLLVVAAGLLALVWTGLPTALRVAVPIYAVLLLSMGALAFSTDVHAGFGAALLIFSDALIALRVADVLPRESVVASLVVMSTYIAALFLLSIGNRLQQFRCVDRPTVAHGCAL